jgi:hypothetical protein
MGHKLSLIGRIHWISALHGVENTSRIYSFQKLSRYVELLLESLELSSEIFEADLLF